MKRPSLEQLERQCQKPDHRRIGNWLARRVARPAALRVTWVVAPWPVSANMATLSAWAVGVAAAVVFGLGGAAGWVLGALLLHLWYLLDHVDGQLARLRGTASLDGVQLDYLMHHTVNLLVPIGMGYGLFARSTQPVWLLAGLIWGVGLLLLGLHHDARYKAFVQRLKRVHGRLEVHGGGGGRPTAQPHVPRGLARRAAWAARKACETHVVMNSVTAIALAAWLIDRAWTPLAQTYVAAMALTASATCLWTLARSQHQQATEAEFARWYRPPEGHDLTFRDGWWHVEPADDKTPQSR